MASIGSIGRSDASEQRLPKTVKVKNKQPSDRQITAEQILREAKEIQLEDDFKAPKTIITATLASVRDVYERAVANLPPGNEKRYWRRYVWLWIKYAVWEELSAGDAERAREVYRACLKLIPHASFTFAKVWLLAAKLEVRARRLDSARRILGTAIGLAPKHKLFRSYIELEMQLGNIDRCRALYEKYVEWAPSSATAWLKFAELESQLGEAARARALFELAVSQPLLDMPEALWKGYIDFEIEQGERERVRILYERLLDRTKHVKVWLSYARFEAEPLPTPEPPEGEEEDEEAAAARAEEEGPEAAAGRAVRARSVYERAFRSLREGQPDAKEEAVMLLEAWREFEQGCAAFRPAGDVAAAVAAVEAKLPRRIKRKRPAGGAAAGPDAPLEEYYDYAFPDEAGGAPNLKLLEAALRWKRQRMGGEEGGG
ncbi:hypothetical protein Rsub_07423 [Raphidocelis subcapitata]|uniref:Pre-mRNA-splicing factor Syf1/CRNKL1-like C-terminal HAT-repeats domain-containing protein n=1 Tax=Raphidocelis subcapitata TaxID=307507 RepID=A0A2V0PBZ1_9CHLO|nr:hypothetical protein Rsub_07423 [Raphidocelis subcapitata]|eukprot:GBF94687.1 hypothetical protein Rsub_07423 [Raphidocelis subcapitata]